jgi:hypothetical protein
MADDRKQWLLLLTATIQPDPHAMGGLRDPELRKNQYLYVLKHLTLKNTGIDRIIFCENSASDLRPFRDLNQRFSNGAVPLEIYEVPMPRVFFGKGWGESLMIRWALENIASIAEYDAFLKITGRYRVLNLKKIIKIIHRALAVQPNMKFVCQTFTHGNRPHAETVFFWSDRRFYVNHLLNSHDEVDDEKGVYIEHVLAKRLFQLSDRFKIGTLPVSLILKGLRGADSKPVMTIRDILRESLKQAILPMPSMKIIGRRE